MRPNWLRGPFGYGTPSAFVARALARKRSSVPRLAIIVSAGGSTESLESTLVSVLEHRPPDCEILVALTGKYADPYQLQDEVRFVQAAPRTGAVAAIRDAIAASRAPFIHVLAGGCTVTEGWVEPALARFGDRNLASVAPLVLDARRPERLLAAGVGYRASGRRILVGHGQPSNAQYRPPPCWDRACLRPSIAKRHSRWSTAPARFWDLLRPISIWRSPCRRRVSRRRWYPTRGSWQPRKSMAGKHRFAALCTKSGYFGAACLPDVRCRRWRRTQAGSRSNRCSAFRARECSRNGPGASWAAARWEAMRGIALGCRD